MFLLLILNCATKFLVGGLVLILEDSLHLREMILGLKTSFNILPYVQFTANLESVFNA